MSACAFEDFGFHLIARLILSIDTKKINDVLKGFATILQSYRPNVQELELIQAKIDSMVEKNRKNMIKMGKSIPSSNKFSQEEKWHQIKVED